MSKRFLWLANKPQPTLVKSPSFDVREGLVRIQAANLVGTDHVDFELRVSNESGPAIWTPYFDMDGRPVTLTAGRPRYVELIAGTYRIVTTATTNSPNLVVTLIEDDLGGDNKVQYNLSVNSGVNLKDPAGAGFWVAADSQSLNSYWVNQQYNELTGLTETTYHDYPGGPRVTPEDLDLEDLSPRFAPQVIQQSNVAPIDLDISCDVDVAGFSNTPLPAYPSFYDGKILSIQVLDDGNLPSTSNVDVYVGGEFGDDFRVVLISSGSVVQPFDLTQNVNHLSTCYMARSRGLSPRLIIQNAGAVAQTYVLKIRFVLLQAITYSRHAV